ncbi:hypothetical protein N7326_06080 [Corynebacterium sp. ES2794-CONJ1]|uniref:hypothetical protein n=1 Tax=unclassified Corynebacterium TaxID=2624378 RepID=UPI002169F7C0|nr:MULTISPECIES: hypothetical protein [unclassified Corynebacterium]MCS4490257.1 hypothetical protein [Corynebacterium sp. ES2775-CONJ]MCS4491932.1 hypothetical protein [Corynebacterium sp. ES2715-CONJ3]MCS4532037.1 hypothetical protein [Corynebacterium sp. ES2730-CONJ]MCU9519438.1 hypothetical protein [Corynebacterium sp. ES2794-CONJ1]
MAPRKALPLRLDPAIHRAVKQLADDSFISVNAQIEILLREALKNRGRLPRDIGDIPRPGRPKKTEG